MHKKIDIKTAFLHGDLDENIFMELPEGYDEKPTSVCKLQKALYGLKQAPLKWNQKLTNFLRKEGLHPLKTEQCIFVNEDRTIMLAIHVDDGLLVGTDKEMLNFLLENLKQNFEMTEIEEPTSFLGIELERNNGYLKLLQSSYIQQLLKKLSHE